ncbi:MAG: enoyl-CoA hydratase-related protein [Gammaproteobacteria bacterium]|nr:enoyl-CoA hydratase-related protein [Gammaproteobacteria bacterium]MDD9871367.1 enoyl-CoA hydratase-related protein [Gammaproteobacteria bacterium]
MSALVSTAGGIATVTLNRPARHNAFDDALIRELRGVLAELAGDAAVRVLALAGAGKSFCAGADLQWMKRAADYDERQNIADAEALAGLLDALFRFPKPTVACVNGAALGGGAGLVSCCDIAIAAAGAKFGFSEVRLGLIPATISPHVVRAIGARAAGKYFLSGGIFDAAEALRIGLVHQVTAAENLRGAVQAQCEQLLHGGPQAQRECKKLLRRVDNAGHGGELTAATARLLARLRAGGEGRAGIAAFLAKRRPPWAPDKK